MKLSSLLKTSFIFLLALGCAHITHAQSTGSGQDQKQEQKALLKNAIDSQNYVFNAQVALPASGRAQQLTGDYYDLVITRTFITAHLPYYGRVYAAPLDPGQAGLQFTSKKFDYRSTPGKKSGWEILIRTRDLQEELQLSLNSSEDGYATLYVTGGDRQAISFNGTISPPKQKNP